MKKKSIVLGVLAVFLTVATVWAAGRGKEETLGSVVAIKRTVELNLEDCEKAYKHENWDVKSCDIRIFENSDEIQILSTSLDNEDLMVRVEGAADVQIKLQPYGYLISSIGDDEGHRNLTKEKFLNAAKMLSEKFPTYSMKLIKVAK